MEGQGSADFWLRAIEVVLLLGVAPSLVIAAVNKYTTRDVYGLYRIVWALVRTHSVYISLEHFGSACPA